MRCAALRHTTWRLSTRARVPCSHRSLSHHQHRGAAAGGLVSSLVPPRNKTASNVLKPPLARRGQGTDPYAWLEKQNDEVLDYLREENTYTCEVMRDTAAMQKELYREIMSRLDHGGVMEGVPERCMGYWYYLRRDDDMNFPVYYRSREMPSFEPGSGWMDASESVVLDQNALPDYYQSFQVGDMKVSPDNALLGFTLAAHDTSSGAGTLYLRDLSNGRWWTVDECWLKVAGFVWGGTHDILYIHEDSLGRPSVVYRAELNDGPERRGLKRQPTLLYREDDDRFFVSLKRTKDGRLVTINSTSKTSSEVRVIPVGTEGHQQQPYLLKPRVEGVHYFVDHGGDHFYIITNAREPGGDYELCRWESSWAFSQDDVPSDGSKWEYIASSTSGTGASGMAIEDIDLFRDFCVLYQRVGGSPCIQVLDLQSWSSSPSSTSLHRVALPMNMENGRLEPCLNQDYDSKTVRFSLTTPIAPRVTYECNMRTRGLSLSAGADGKKKEEEGKGDEEHYVCRRVYTPERGAAPIGAAAVSVPLTLVHKRTLQRDGSHPVLLISYGAYGQNVDVGYRSEYLSLLSRGWVLAFAHVRGGGEMGRAWHRAGRGHHKPNSIADYLGCADWLVEEGYTVAGKVAAYGSSAGGLLVAAAANWRPELFGAMILNVPFLDIVRTMTDPSLPLTIHEYDEWGNPAVDPVVLQVMRSYSPYETLRVPPPSSSSSANRCCYPHTLVLASLKDDRVRYWEAAKWMAKARDVFINHSSDKRPPPLLLLRTEGDRGHAGHATLSEMVYENAFEWAFLLRSMGGQSREEQERPASPFPPCKRRRSRRTVVESPLLKVPYLAWPKDP